MWTFFWSLEFEFDIDVGPTFSFSVEAELDNKCIRINKYKTDPILYRGSKNNEKHI